jgi:hypothetical protein
MIGSGTPSNHNSAPRPNPMVSSSELKTNDSRGERMFQLERGIECSAVPVKGCAEISSKSDPRRDELVATFEDACNFKADAFWLSFVLFPWSAFSSGAQPSYFDNGRVLAWKGRLLPCSVVAPGALSGLAPTARRMAAFRGGLSKSRNGRALRLSSPSGASRFVAVRDAFHRYAALRHGIRRQSAPRTRRGKIT